MAKPKVDYQEPEELEFSFEAENDAEATAIAMSILEDLYGKGNVTTE